MSLNTNFYIQKKPIVWQGQDVCEVRGITPNDLAQAMTENAADMEAVVLLLEKDKDLANTGDMGPDAIQAMIESNTKRLFTSVLTSAPNLVAKLIAIACDSPDQWEFVKANYVLPLQFEIIREVAMLTFVDGEGFKAFLGNVMALAGNVGAGQRSQAINLNLPEPADTAG
jgi:hypothetical protein